MAGIGQLLSALTAIFPLKVVIGIAVALALFGIPYWIESIRDRQIRGAVRQLIRADPERRPALVARALELAGTRRNRLLVVVEVAIKYDQPALRDRALALLDEHGATADAVRIRRSLVPVGTKYRDPIEALVRIEALYAEGLRVAADEQLTRARDAFPTDPDLAALADRVRTE